MGEKVTTLFFFGLVRIVCAHEHFLDAHMYIKVVFYFCSNEKPRLKGLPSFFFFCYVNTLFKVISITNETKKCSGI